jgi:hypothetical protein
MYKAVALSEVLCNDLFLHETNLRCRNSVFQGPVQCSEYIVYRLQSSITRPAFGRCRHGNKIERGSQRDKERERGRDIYRRVQDIETFSKKSLIFILKIWSATDKIRPNMALPVAFLCQLVGQCLSLLIKITTWPASTLLVGTDNRNLTLSVCRRPVSRKKEIER